MTNTITKSMQFNCVVQDMFPCVTAILEWYRAAGLDLHLQLHPRRDPYTQLMAVLIVAIKVLHFPETVSHCEVDSEVQESDGRATGISEKPQEYSTTVGMFESEFDWRVWSIEKVDSLAFRHPQGLQVRILSSLIFILSSCTLSYAKENGSLL